MDLQSNQEPLLFRLRYTCSITGKEAPKISGRDTFKLLLFTTFLTSTKVLDTKLCSWFSSYNRIEMLIQLLHLTSCTSSDMNSLYTTTNSLHFFQASVELYTRYTCRHILQSKRIQIQSSEVFWSSIITWHLLTCYKDVGSPKSVSSFHKAPHSYAVFHFYSIRDCVPYLKKKVKVTNVYWLEYNIQFGRNIRSKRKISIFNTE